MKITKPMRATHLTDDERHVLLHALGLTRGPISYRNRYVTHIGAVGFQICEQLRERGLMTRRILAWVDGYIYIVTAAGKASLDMEIVEVD